MADDFATSTVLSRPSPWAPRALLRAVSSGLVVLAGCGTSEQEKLFRPVDTRALANMPAPTGLPILTIDPELLIPPVTTPAVMGETGGPPPMTPVAPPAMGGGMSPAAQPPAGTPPVPGETDPDPMEGDGDPPERVPGAPLACPSTATFCSDFEGTDPLAGATYVSQRGDFMPGSLVLDAAERFSGQQSLLVPADTLNFDYRMLSVPVPGNDFWVRLELRTDVLFGDGDIDTLFLASVLTEGFNGDEAMQLSEQLDQVVANKNGQLFGATRENPMAGDPVTRLLPDEWHCLEAFFGGTSGDMLVFLAGEPIITAPAWQPETYQTFRFGYLRFSTARNVWIDDVAVSLERIGCQ